MNAPASIPAASILLPAPALASSGEDKEIFETYSLVCNIDVRTSVDFAKFVEATLHLGLDWLLLNETPPASR